MSKAILVVDVNMTSDNKHICEDDKQRCSLWNTDTNFCMYNFNNNTKGCPLKPMPIISKKRIDDLKKWGWSEQEILMYENGFDYCVDKISGAKE